MLTLAALSDPTRFHIVEILASAGRLPVADIGKHFSISPPAISQHLKILKKANLVCVEKAAQQRIYSLNPSGLSEIENWAAQVKQMWEMRLDALDAFLKEETLKSKPV